MLHTCIQEVTSIAIAKVNRSETTKYVWTKKKRFVTSSLDTPEGMGTSFKVADSRVVVGYGTQNFFYPLERASGKLERAEYLRRAKTFSLHFP